MSNRWEQAMHTLSFAHAGDHVVHIGLEATGWSTVVSIASWRAAKEVLQGQPPCSDLSEANSDLCDELEVLWSSEVDPDRQPTEAERAEMPAYTLR